MQRVRQLIDQRLAARAHQMEALTLSLRQLLPPALAPHCWVCGLDGDRLSMVVEGGARATQLRYLQREILKHLNAHHALQLKQARIQVTANAGTAPLDDSPARGRQPFIPANAGEALRETARTMTDPDLARALERLAARAADKPAP